MQKPKWDIVAIGIAVMLALAVWMELGHVASGISGIVSSINALETRLTAVEGQLGALAETVEELPPEVDRIARLSVACPRSLVHLK